MTAEEKLKDRYRLLEKQGGWNSKDNVLMSPYDIDLIVELVVERVTRRRAVIRKTSERPDLIIEE